ncbi:hypothetical protein ACWGJW_42595, partial [Streptomyces nigrescens]
MQVLDHPAVDGDDTAPFTGGFVESVDDLLRTGDLVGGRGEGQGAGFDMRRMDERLHLEHEL